MSETRAAHNLYIIGCLKRFVARHGHRLVQADGTLSDLFVSVAEAGNLLGTRVSPAPRTSELAGWPSLEEADREVAAARAALGELPAGSPWVRLRGLFGLDDGQLRLMMAAAAPLESVDIARLYSFAMADFSAKLPTVGFLAELVADNSGEIPLLINQFRADGPIARHHLVTLGEVQGWGEETPLLHRAAQVPARVMDFLAGQADPLPAQLDAAARLEPATGWPALEDLFAPPEVLKDLIAGIRRAEADPKRRPRILLVGKRGSGRRTLLASALGMRGTARMITVDLERLPERESACDEALRDICREALLGDCALLLRGDALFDDVARLTALARPLARAVNGHAGVVVLAAQHPVAQLHRVIEGLFELVLPPLAPAQQRAAWKSAVAAARCEAEADIDEKLAERFDLTPGLIHQAVGEARARALWASEGARVPSLTAIDIIGAVRRQSDHALGQIAEPFSTTLTWDDVVLPDDVMGALVDVLNHARYRSVVYDKWGFRRKMAYGRGLSCLFYGPPGTGKTMVAAVLAESLGRELYRIDLSRVTSKWVGETEKNLARVFDEAERAQVILLFDEADSLFSARTDVKSANDRFANMEINYLLQRMESYDGMTVLTTNFDTSIDEAFKRRIKFRIAFPVPDAAHRAQLWRSMLPKQAPVEASLPFEELGEKYELAGGSIKNAVLRAAFYAAEEGGRISIEHLHRAAVAESEEMGRLISR